MLRRSAAIVDTLLLLTAALSSIPTIAKAEAPPVPSVIVVPARLMQPDAAHQGWSLTPQDASYASHTYGGMWVADGVVLGAPATSTDASASATIQVPAAGSYRVWSKYQAPPYFNYIHKIEVLQGGKTIYSYVYGKREAERLWSFTDGLHKQIWWGWGVDHDAAEAPKETANLQAGPAEVRITAIAQPQPAGDRMINFVVLTTSPRDGYQGDSPRTVGTPFIAEALATDHIYLRFKNTTDKPAVLGARTAGHMQPDYGGRSAVYPAPNAPVASGQWSPWSDIGPICQLTHDEGVFLSLGAGANIEVQVARNADGTDIVGETKVANGEAIVIPIDITWNKKARVLSSREHAQQIIDLCKNTWRTANGGKKPTQIAYYGAFAGNAPWIAELKDALGYNTLLPDSMVHLSRDGYYQHASTAANIENLANSLTPQQKDHFRIVSFGDEIHLGRIDYKDPKNIEAFRAWLKAKNLTSADIGMEIAQATLSESDPKLNWYSTLFNEEQQFEIFGSNTKLAEKLIGPNVQTGANYSPHSPPQYYGPIFQWVDIFKHRGMSAFWTEDYVFSVPEAPQILSWTFATMRCAIKYHDLPMHVYIMPHAPGQTAANLRKSMYFAVGGGAAAIDGFWVAPAENFTENFVAWNYLDTFKVIHESIFDSAEVEHVSIGAKVRPARVAIVLSKATDFNEPLLKVDPTSDSVAGICDNFPQWGWQQTLCRNDQQLIYLALRNNQHSVELVTEDDLVEGVNGKSILENYDVIYFAGEWIETHAAGKLDAWVKNGGILYAAAGLGHLNQFNQPEPAMLQLLGIKSVATQKNAYQLRELLELPLVKPIDTITLASGEKIPAVGMKQVLTLDPASGVKTIGTWSDGSAAVTVRDYGKGKAFAVGALPGHDYFKTGVKVAPWARGGNKNTGNIGAFDPSAATLALLGVNAKPSLPREITLSLPGVEAEILDNQTGTLLTLVNWTSTPAKNVTATLKLPFKPSSARLISAQKNIPVTYENGIASITIDVAEAEYVLFNK